MAPLLEVIPLRLKAVLHKPGEPLRYVYFPGGGFCSILTVLNDGDMVAVATIGREGMAGASAGVNSGAPDPSATWFTPKARSATVCRPHGGDPYRSNACE